MSGFFAPQQALAAATVTPASGGTNISIDTTSATGGSNTFTELSGPGITEQAAGDIDEGTHTVTLPAGWVFDTASPITVSKIGNIGLASTNITPGATSFEFTITSVSTNTSILIFNGIKVKPTGTDPSTNSGNMTYSGAGIVGVTPGEGGTNFGTLSTVASTVAKVVFETQPGNAVYGSLLSSQPVVKTQDQFGNDSVVGLGTSKIVTLSLSSGTGNLLNTFSLDIGTSAGNGTVTFTNVTVDTFGAGKQLTASADSLTPAISTAFEITKKTLTATITADSKPYDGNNSATFTNPIPVEVAFSDVLTLSGGPSTSATFADANAGPGKTVTATGLTLVGDKADNYTYDGTATGTANITQLTVPGSFTTESKVYNGNTTASVLSQSLSGVLAGDSENVALTGGTASFADANVGTGITVTASGMSLSGSASGNYSLTSVDTEVADITPAPLTVTADAKSKVYGAVDPALTYTHGALAGSDTEAVFAGSLARAMGENVGTYAITQGTLFAGSNYTVSFTGANLTITQKPLTVSFTTDANKTYNGNATADITGRSLDGVIDPEIVGVTGGSATFADKDVGPSKTVTATGFTLTGADKDNYAIGTINTTTGNVNARPITVTAQTDTKTYNGTTSSDETPIVTSGFSPAVATVDSALFTQAYNNKNVGTGKTLTPSGIVHDGNPDLEGSNYAVTIVPILTGVITEKALTATVTVERRVFDGTTDATIIDVQLNELETGDVVTVSNDGIATFASPDAGTDIVVTSNGVTITGDDAGNYSFNGTATGTGDILPIPTVVYVDDNWAETDMWEDPDGIGPATAFGYDAFATIQEAIDAVASSGTVNVLSGTYTESVTINKSLTVQKEMSALTKPIIQANDSWGFKLLGAADITADGFEIQITGGGSANDQAIRLENADDAVIKNNTITTTADTALGIWTCGTDSGCASSDNVNINDNNITIGGVATGIYAEQVDVAHTGWSITGNTIIANTGVPLELYDVTDSIVDDNTLDGSTTNSNTIWSSQRSDISGLVFTNNIISDSSGSMVAFLSDFLLLGDGLDDTTVSGVNINGNTFNGWGSRGLRIGDDVTAVTANENKFLGTGEALKNEDAASVNAENNWWGTAVAATIDGKTNGAIDFEPYYVESGMSILSNVAVNAAYVDSTYSDGAENGGHYFGYDAFATIQEGIDAVASSGTVNVATGVYDEQLQINKDVTVSGATGATIQPTGNDDAWDIQFTTGGSGATLLGFTMDFNGLTDNRPGRGIGVSDQGGPAVTNVTIQNNDITMGVGIGAATGGLEGVGIQTGLNADVSGLLVTGNQFHGGSAVISDGNSQGEEGIYINPNSGTGSVTISNNTFDGQLFTGISIESDRVTASGNTVSRSAIVQNTNGIRVNDFVGGKSYDVTLTNNVVSGFANGFRFGSVSDGGSTLAISLTDNTISNNTRGIWVRHDATVTASGNSITGNTTGAEILDGSDGSLSAEANWWGQSTGPADGAVVGTVDYRPWCTNEACSPIDTTSPTVTVDTLLTNDTTPVITGTVVESNAVTVTITVNSQNYVAVVTSGTWSANVTNELTAGTYSVVATAEDSAGNIGTDGTNNELQIDLTAPTVSLTKDHADLIVRDADTVIVTATFNEAMASSPTITINAVADDVTGVAMTNTSGNVWTYSWNVPAGNDGSAVVTVAGTDVAGNAYAGTDSLTFTIDNTAPVVAITQPTVNSRVNAAKVITFTDGESTTPQCSIDNSVWVVCTSGTTTLGDVTGFGALTDGNVTLYLRDTDAAGNTGTTQVVVVKDTSVPSIISKTPGASAVGIDPTSNITVVFNEDVVITDAQVTVKKGSSPAVSTAVSFVSGTETAMIDPSVTLDNNSTYTVTLTGVTDTVGNALPTTSWVFTTSASYSIALTTGWNLISLPVVPTDTQASAVLGTTLNDAAKIETVWKYDPVAGTWGAYHPGSPGTSNFSTMTAGEGYWINYLSSGAGTVAGTGNLFQEGNSTPPQKTLAAGWNLIGYYQLENVTNTTATKALSTVAGQWTQLRTYNNTDKQFQAVIGSNYMKPGEGYWIFMKSSSYAPYLYGPGDTD